ncbi:hypothetical protein EI983_05695 [Roseovarius faecimaris]|uniref:Sulfotransferase family protein n=1 Tax=Roseovarius faecimaris TaxID=2494550 RepID=A0A6I6IRB8_9RHOB|nr:hypothetical protein [Roseovarius faecimaris]QGX97796.1 hypothetical protein EI983_05695 [Roseovarius faecimaris]
MDIILHLGAHRTASTCFQYYLREKARQLSTQGIGVWGPWRTRDGVLTGVLPVPGAIRSPKDQHLRARGRISLALHRLREKGVKQLIVSDENMIGAPRRNLRTSKIYDGIGERMAQFSDAFSGGITQVVLSIRSQETYWSSVYAFAVGRGHRLPSRDDLDRLVTTNRHWREAIRDLSCALPGVKIIILPYEEYGGRPEQKLSIMTGLSKPPMKFAREWINRSPSLAQLRQILKDRGEDPAALPEGEGRWHPFDHAQSMALREAYADDLFWLRAGAEGMATLIEGTGTHQTGQTRDVSQMTRGQTNGIENRRMA